MSYLHGVYTSEKETSVIPGINAPSAVPFVIGTNSDMGGIDDAKLISSWQEFCDTFDYEDAASFTGEDKSNTIAAFARHWYLESGGGDAIFVAVECEEEDGQWVITGGASIVNIALEQLETVYEKFGVVPGVVLVPGFPGLAIDNALVQACKKFGNGFSCVALRDLAYDGTDSTIGIAVHDTHLIYCAPRAKVKGEIVPASIIVASALAVTDSENGGFPSNSPSNKLARIDGVVDASTDADPLYFTRDQVNDKFNAFGIVSFWHNDAGWVVWGNNTSAYPSSTDPKDRWIPVRRTFSYIRNDVIRYMAPRVDAPITKRQLDGVVNSYNMRLAGFKGSGIVNSARVFVDWQKTTPEQLLSGAVWFGVAISPPPPAEQIHFSFEYDVPGFVDSLS